MTVYPEILEARILRQTLAILTALAAVGFGLLGGEALWYLGAATLFTAETWPLLAGALVNFLGFFLLPPAKVSLASLRRLGMALVLADFAVLALNTLFFSGSLTAVIFGFLGMSVFVVITGLVSRSILFQALFAAFIAAVFTAYALVAAARRPLPALPAQGGAARILLWGGISLGAIMTSVLAYAAQEGYLVSYFRRLSLFDTETGFPNGKLLEADLTDRIAALRKGGRLALFAFRIEGLGELAGLAGPAAAKRWFDLMLLSFSDTLDEWQRYCPRFVFPREYRIYRAETDLFYLIVEDPTGTQDLAECAKKLESRFRGDFLKHETEAATGFLAAYTVYPDHAASADQLRGSVYRMVSRQARETRNRIVSFDAELHGRYAREIVLRKALVKTDFSVNLSVVFQPKVSVDTGSCTGFEALVRWTHPELGPVSPSEFIPIAEETPAIEMVTGFVFRETLAFVRRLNELPGGSEVRVSFNLSPKLATTVFLSPLADRLRDLPEARQIEMEITEGVVIRENEAVRSLFRRLRELGVRFSIDDFGTGYSNLSYLQGFRPDSLKIDRRFVCDLPGNAENENLLKAMLALAETFSMGAVVEGVETEDQARFIAQCGGREIQGFYYSRPVPPAEALEFFKKRNPRR